MKENQEIKIPADYQWTRDEFGSVVRVYVHMLMFNTSITDYRPGLETDTTFAYEGETLHAVIYANTAWIVEKILVANNA